MNRALVFLAGSSLIITAATMPAQNLLVNGSFELPVLSSNGVWLPPGSTNLTGWTMGTNGAGTLLVRSSPQPSAVDGMQFIGLGGTTLIQSFQTPIGEIYEASFDVGSFRGSIRGVLAEAMSSTGDVLASVSAPAPGQIGWASKTRFRFGAATPTSTIRFTAPGGANLDLTLDDVSVERVTPHLSIECSEVRVCWESQTNQTYQLQCRSELTTNVWTDLGTPLQGNGETNCTVQPVAEPPRFYRVVRLP
jgi:hypothetical protein